MYPPLIAAIATLLLLIATESEAIEDESPLPGTQTPCHIVGLTERVLCQQIEVPYDWKDPEAHEPVSLRLVIMESYAETPADEALVILAGGPGQAATEIGGMIQPFLEEARQRQDVLLLDQRGTGGSESLNCQDYDNLEALTLDPNAFKTVLKSCRESWRADLQHFGSAEVIRDLEHVRAQLGYPQLDLWGASWGTRTALLYMRSYPGKVRSAVLDGVAPPNTTIFEHEARFADAALSATLEACAADAACGTAFPDLEARFRQWLDAFDEPISTSVQVPDTGKRVEVPLDMTAIVQPIRAMLYSVNTAAMIPYVISELIDGNPAPLVASASSNAGPDAGIMHIGLTLSTLCAEDIERTPADLIAERSAGTFTGDTYYQLWADFCSDWPAGQIADDYREPVTSDVPTLLLSGAVDPVTAPDAAEVAARSLGNARHVTAPETGHIVTRGTCAIDLVTTFQADLAFDDLETDCLGKPGRPAFVTLFNGPQP